MIQNYQDVFEGLGCLPQECHITVLPDVKPKIDAQRRIPFKLHKQLKDELDRMEKMQVIERVIKPTKWVSSIVIVEKPNKKLRICLDPRNLNNAIQRSHYPMPTIEDIRYKLNGAKVFSHLDAFSGFWMCKLDEPSSELCTFNTPFGRYKFKRLPYGLNCSTEIFSKILIDTFSDIQGVVIFVDDLMIYAPDIETHNSILEKVLTRARSVNLKFNRDKCQFAKNEIKFLGQIFNSQGMSPDNDKIQAITEMPIPKCQKDLQRFLGMINFLSPYIKNMSDETQVLRKLLKKDIIWSWEQCHNIAFSRLKKLITEAPVLVHYDSSQPLILSVDASQSAVGCVLLQNNRPIAYSSRTLTDSQRNYAQIEKELFAILCGCQKFHQYVYGQRITVQTDHKPLITLFEKPLAQVPCRLQRMMLSLQIYDLEVIYVPGSKLYISDTLSRAPLPMKEEHCIDKDISIHVNSFMSTISASESKIQEFKKASLQDNTLQILKKYCLEGWPKHKNKLIDSIKPYWNYQSEITVIDGLLFKNTAIIVPDSMRKEMLTKIHSGHLGISRSKNLARGSVFWPTMNSEIKNIVEQCPICVKYRSSNPHESLIVSETPSVPWEKLGTDLFHFNGKVYIVVMDYYSKYIEMSCLNNNSSAVQVIIQLKAIFARHGIPLTLVTDNGPPFNSALFKDFIYNWDINHITTSPNFPQANGQSESAVKIAKRILQKSLDDNIDPYLALLHYRANVKEYLKSPAELLMSRKLRTNIPVKRELLKPKIVQFKEVKEKLQVHKNKYKKYYDRSVRNLPSLSVGDKIRFKKTPFSQWSPGIIHDIVKHCPRSYIVKSDDGTLYRRNRHHIILDKSARYNKSVINNDTKMSQSSCVFSPSKLQSFSQKGRSFSPIPLSQSVSQSRSPMSESYSQRYKSSSPRKSIVISPCKESPSIIISPSKETTRSSDTVDSNNKSYKNLPYSCNTNSQSSDSQSNNNSNHNQYNNGPCNQSDVKYTTRSGRVIKPPNRFC